MAPEPATGPLATRLETLEAMALLVAARLLVVLVGFRWWRGWLGRPVEESSGSDEGVQRIDRHCAKVVNRALAKLPFACKCLPQAMALHWMLRRRGRHGQLVIAVLPGSERNGLDNLHAWVEIAGEILIGELAQTHRPVIRFSF